MTILGHAMEAVKDIRKRYIESIEEASWDTIGEFYRFAFMDILANEINAGILYVTNKIIGLDFTLRKYAQSTGIISPKITLASYIKISHILLQWSLLLLSQQEF